ncbi:MAG: SCP2 sterol-binding domain-containing protein [Thauera sp.]|jgi:ubiquinone biosynthesis protein UbiJ|nr:SCP2 sterol-binding domain-containing protein [Thauera sp.]
MIESLLFAALNHVLAQNSWARERLAVHAGRNAILSLDPVFRLGFLISADGLLGSWPDGESELADVQLKLAAAQLPSLLSEGPAAVMNKVRIEGNAEFAEAIGFVFRHLRWDAEEDLARVVGDIGAHRISTGLRSFHHSALDIFQRGHEGLTEYLVEEARLLTPDVLLAEQQSQLIELRDRLGRLQQRIERIERRRGS